MLRRPRRHWPVILALTLLDGTLGQRAGAQNTQGPDGPARPKIAASDLRALTGYEFTIATATLIPATSDAPEHCRVTGQILPEIRFEISLPTAWNRRFYMFGNGGYAGEFFEASGRVSPRNAALRRGFAIAGTDTGHNSAVEPLGTFATNRQKSFGKRWTRMSAWRPLVEHPLKYDRPISVP